MNWLSWLGNRFVQSITPIVIWCHANHLDLIRHYICTQSFKISQTRGMKTSHNWSNLETRNGQGKYSYIQQWWLWMYILWGHMCQDGHIENDILCPPWEKDFSYEMALLWTIGKLYTFIQYIIWYNMLFV